MRPEVYAPDLSLGRHQNPYDGNLCLLDSQAAWLVGDTAAWLVAERVPLLLSLLEQGGEALRAGEAPQGEPASVYFPWVDGTLVLVPAEALAIEPDASHGSGRIACRPDQTAQLHLRGLVAEASIKTRKRKVRRTRGCSPRGAAAPTARTSART